MLALDDDFGEDTASAYNELLPFIIVIDHRSLEGLHLLLKPHFLNHLWKIDFHLAEALNIMRAESWSEGIQAILQSHCFETSFNALSYREDTRLEHFRALHHPLND